MERVEHPLMVTETSGHSIEYLNSILCSDGVIVDPGLLNYSVSKGVHINKKNVVKTIMAADNKVTEVILRQLIIRLESIVRLEEDRYERLFFSYICIIFYLLEDPRGPLVTIDPFVTVTANTGGNLTFSEPYLITLFHKLKIFQTAAEQTAVIKRLQQQYDYRLSNPLIDMAKTIATLKEVAID